MILVKVWFLGEGVLRWCDLVFMEQPVIILNALFRVIWNFCMLVSEATRDQMVLAYSIVIQNNI